MSNVMVKRRSPGELLVGFIMSSHQQKGRGQEQDSSENVNSGIVIPARLSLQDAATLGVVVITIGQSLYQSLRLALPPSSPPSSPPYQPLHHNTSSYMGFDRGRHRGDPIRQALRLHGGHDLLTAPA
ncbi:uncharacterized protein BO72DRAFT_492139 [Aspergillus fijiensis CBS 313.89]|uniref:Uncharacterized protein n=1 Tax=Aspergillus fijiensis CBS 313.89 TaxID=1448319 RepID=A0A8G1RZV2_9EURO|nr:uncharacterized protein BO72DRAFT_492139 [Aspergillus fijiensis CBS 313.89]RAK81914.1 hypothetical protein BO72DRAFT_492139 [Aspergillus fijiensis CBS 313.89]